MKKLMMAVVSMAAVTAMSDGLRVGIIGCDTSHAIAFTKLMNVEKAPDCHGATVVAAYQWGSRDIFSATNRYPKYLAQLKEMGVSIEPTVDELLKKVDCVCLETNDGREHLWQAEKVFAAGKRVFIDKPLAHNLTDALRIYEAGKRHGARYFSSSALRFGDVAVAARAGAYGKIASAALIAPSPEEPTHNFYTWYGIHGFEPLVAMMGMGVEKVSCFRNEAGDVVSAVWKDGRMASLRLQRNRWTYSGHVLPEKPKDPKNPVVVFDGYKGYQPLVKEIIRFFETGVAPVPPEETLEIMAFMEAAEMSARRGGEPVTLAEAVEACSDRPFWKFW